MKVTVPKRPGVKHFNWSQLACGVVYEAVGDISSSPFYLKTDESKIVHLSSGILFSREQMGADFRFREVDAEVVIK